VPNVTGVRYADTVWVGQLRGMARNACGQVTHRNGTRYRSCNILLLSSTVSRHKRTDERTNERTDGRADRQTPGIEFGASVTYGGNNFNEFPDN